MFTVTVPEYSAKTSCQHNIKNGCFSSCSGFFASTTVQSYNCHHNQYERNAEPPSVHTIRIFSTQSWKPVHEIKLEWTGRPKWELYGDLGIVSRLDSDALFTGDGRYLLLWFNGANAYQMPRLLDIHDGYKNTGELPWPFPDFMQEFNKLNTKTCALHRLMHQMKRESSLSPNGEFFAIMWLREDSLIFCDQVTVYSLRTRSVVARIPHTPLLSGLPKLATDLNAARYLEISEPGRQNDDMGITGVQHTHLCWSPDSSTLATAATVQIGRYENSPYENSRQSDSYLSFYEILPGKRSCASPCAAGFGFRQLAQYVDEGKAGGHIQDRTYATQCMGFCPDGWTFYQRLVESTGAYNYCFNKENVRFRFFTPLGSESKPCPKAIYEEIKHPTHPVPAGTIPTAPASAANTAGSGPAPLTASAKTTPVKSRSASPAAAKTKTAEKMASKKRA